MTLVTLRVVFLSTLAALALGPLATWLARRWGLLDVPGSAPHKKHPSTTALAGGLVLVGVLLLVGLPERLFVDPTIWPVLAAGGLIFLFGVADDRLGLAARWKLAGQILAALVLIALGVSVRLFEQNWMNFALTMVWMVGITNAYNFVDSMDGLATGLAGLAAAFFMLVSVDSGQLAVSLFSALLLGACAGIYYYTAPPARFFLGDSGAQFLGFVLAGLAIVYNPAGYLRTQSWFIPILLVGVPIFDTTLVVVSRWRRGKPIHRSGLDHTYHRLVAWGLDPARAVLTMQFVALLLGCLAFISLSLAPLAANLLFGLCVFAGLIVLLILERYHRF